MKTKIIPFDLETAKKIQAGEIEGKIKTKHGDDARVICWNRLNKTHPIIALVHNMAGGGAEESVYYTNNGKVFEDRYDLTNLADLVLEVSDNEPQFEPFDRELALKAGTEAYYNISTYIKNGKLDGTFNNIFALGAEWMYKHLVGTTDKPKEE